MPILRVAGPSVTVWDTCVTEGLQVTSKRIPQVLGLSPSTRPTHTVTAAQAPIQASAVVHPHCTDSAVPITSPETGSPRA